MRFLGVCLALGLAMAGSRAELAAATKWKRLQTDDFVIYSTSSEREMVEFAVGYSAFRHTLRTFLLNGAVLPPSTLVLFRTPDALRPYLPPSPNREMEIVNFTTEVDGEALMALALSGNRRQALELTYEFETSWALRRLGYFVPLWMGQGAGEVLASVQVRKDKCILGDGPERFSDQWRRVKPLPWERFFNLTFNSPEYSGARADGVAQAQSWALMHRILLEGDGGQARFEALAAKLRTSPPLEAVQAVLGVPPADWETNISNHLLKRDSQREIPFDAARTRAELKPGPAAEVEVEVHLANLLVAAGRTNEGEAVFARVRVAAPESAPVKEWLARRELRRNDADEAARLYREAIAAGSRNAIAYLVSATARINDSRSAGIDRAGGGGENIEVAVGEIRQALRLNPGSGDAYRLLSRALFVRPKLTLEHLAELTPGLLSGPGSEVVRYYRALLYERLEMKAEAVADLRWLVESPATGVATKRHASERLEWLTRPAR